MKQINHRLLSLEAFEAATAFIKNHGRTLEYARFNAIFNGANVRNVVVELKKFQNTDGGFGHALEADLRAPESSVLCTSIAFQIIREHGITPDEDMVQSALHYLVKEWVEEESYWRIIPKSADSSPHAPWWKQKGRDEEYDTFSLNPSAEILGYLLDYGDQVVDTQAISKLSERVVEVLKALKKIEMHDLLCCLRLIESKRISSVLYNTILTELKRLLGGAISTTPEEWANYGLKPLLVISSPESPFIDAFQEAIEANIEFEMNEQHSDGSWLPNWSWGNAYTEVWNIAKREWAGVLTLEKLKTLKRFGRIETTERERL